MLKFMIHMILEILLLCSLVFNTFIFENYDTSFTLIGLVIFFIASIFLVKEKSAKSRKTGDAIFVVVGLSVILLGIFYLIGFSTGFINNYNTIFKNYIEDIVWIKVFLVVILTELVRYVTIPYDNKYKVRNTIHYILMILIFVMVDINISTKIYDLSRLNQLYEFVSLIVVQSISKNIFLTYLTKHYGMKPSLLYRLFIDLYIYIIPITPKLNIFIEGVVMLVFPYFVYMILQSIAERRAADKGHKRKKENKFVSVISGIVFAILVALVSREFEYCMIAIGSGSMTGTINKGDAVIYKAFDQDEDESPQTGDILVFYKDNMIIVHRIIKKYTVYGEEVFQTQGDANEKPDNWIVKKEDVIGVVKQRVPLIAWPSVKLNELF